jgi:uncharacterized protein with NRDE domain
MCVLAFATRTHDRWPLVLAGNRDERHDRPAAALYRWTEAPYVLAGRDLTAGGAWLGVSERNSRLVTVTNLRSHSPNQPSSSSRGWLVRDLLFGEDGAEDRRPDALLQYNPFNLLLLSPSEDSFWTNSPVPGRTSLAPGVYGLGNGTLNEPAPRVQRLRQGLSEWLNGEAEDLEPLFALLADSRPLRGADGAPSAPIFLHNPVFGSRCSTVVRVARDGHGEIVERRYDREGLAIGQTALSFKWPMHYQEDRPGRAPSAGVDHP